MKGKYNGCIMSVTGIILPGASRLARLQVGLSQKARQRLKWFDYYNSHDHNARLTCRHFSKVIFAGGCSGDVEISGAIARTICNNSSDCAIAEIFLLQYDKLIVRLLWLSMLNEGISIEELTRKRTPSELMSWVEQKMDQIESTDEGERALRLHD